MKYFSLESAAAIRQNEGMKMLPVILLIGGLLIWQGTVRAGDAFLWKTLRYHVTRNGYPMPERILRVGSVVKVVAIHGAKAEIVTASGDTVTVSREYLHMVAETPPPESTPIPPPAIATPAPPGPTPLSNQASGGGEKALGTSPARSSSVATLPVASPSPSPDRDPGGGEKADAAGPARTSETGKRSVPVRCSHLTKKGEQCSRMTTSPNGLCWQHGGN